jgi:glyoxylase I family protein
MSKYTNGTPIRRLHHHAFVVADQERNRHFIEDLIGLPLAATWCEHSPTYNDMPFCHTFFELADGSALAFFQMAPPYDQTFLIGPKNRYHHVALDADADTLDAISSRLSAEGVEYAVQDHGYVKSLYVTSPDGLMIEIAVDPPNVEEIKAKRRADAHSELARWLAGNHESNNEWRSSDHAPAASSAPSDDR